MTVVMGEVEVIPDRSVTRGEGAPARDGTGGASMSPAQLEAQVQAIMRRETARMERLWAD